SCGMIITASSLLKSKTKRKMTGMTIGTKKTTKASSSSTSVNRMKNPGHVAGVFVSSLRRPDKRKRHPASSKSNCSDKYPCTTGSRSAPTEYGDYADQLALPHNQTNTARMP